MGCTLKEFSSRVNIRVELLTAIELGLISEEELFVNIDLISTGLNLQTSIFPSFYNMLVEVN
jgi:hypothetical protein